MDGFPAMEMSLIILIDLPSTAEILHWIPATSSNSSSPVYKHLPIQRNKVPVNICDWELACQQMPETAPLWGCQIPDVSSGNSGQRVGFSPEGSYAPRGLSFPSTCHSFFRACAKDKPRSLHCRSVLAWQELVKYEAEEVCSESLPDFSQQIQYEIWVAVKALLSQGRFTEVRVVLHFDQLGEAAHEKSNFAKSSVSPGVQPAEDTALPIKALTSDVGIWDPC